MPYDVLRILFILKNPTASAGFEPANLGTKVQHATSRPPKPQPSNDCGKFKYKAWNTIHGNFGRRTLSPPVNVRTRFEMTNNMGKEN